MTTLTWPAFKRLCGIFCCPPCPGVIAAKLAFLPPEPTYMIEVIDEKKHLILKDEAEWHYSDKELEYFVPFTIQTSRRQTVACTHIICSSTPKYTILFSHGNAVDIGLMSSFLLGLGMRLQCNVLIYDYSGYGCSTGKPTEVNVYADAEAAWQWLTKECKISPDRIILHGQSIGTAPTCHLAAEYKTGGVILHSALTSGLKVALPNSKGIGCCDAFRNIEKVPKITSVVLVIHGTEDEVVDFSHGQAIYEHCPRTVEPLWVVGAGHNDIELYPQYIERLSRFVDIELPAHNSTAQPDTKD